MMNGGLVDFLVCPECWRAFKLTVKNLDGDEIVDGVLECESCSKEYLITAGVPRIIPAELDYTTIKTAKNFGYEWEEFGRFHEEYRKQFEDWIKPLEPDFFKNKIVLDAGCGKGRHTRYSSVFGASDVVGVDISKGVDVAYCNTKDMKNVHIIQADIQNLPLKKDFFDFAYSIGVVHHLSDPKAGFRKILEHVKPGGTILVWVYGREGNVLLPMLNFVRKNVTLHIPLKAVKVLSYACMLFIHPSSKIIGVISRGGLASRFQKHIPMNAFFCYLAGHSFSHNTLILFDQFIAPVSNYYTKDEFECFFRENNVKDFRIIHRNNNSWTGVGVK